MAIPHYPIPHYPYLLLKMLGPHGVLSLRGGLKRVFDFDVQSIQIAAKAQAAGSKEEISFTSRKINFDELEIPAKNPTILAPPKEANIKMIDLGTGDPAKTAIISAHLTDK